MDQISIISLKPYRAKDDSPQTSQTNHSVRSEDDYELISKIKPLSSPQASLTPLQANSFLKSENSQHGSSEASDRLQGYSVQSTLGHGQLDGKTELIACCFCKKQLARKKTLMKHMRERHSFELISDKYLIMRKFLIQFCSYSMQEYFNEHKELIKRVQNSELISIPIPQQLNERMDKKFVNSVRQKYEDFKVTFEFCEIKYYKIGKCKQKKENNILLGRKALQSLKCLVLRYFIEFQRYFEIFIKNISLSELITFFLYSFTYNLPRYNAKILNYENMQLFTEILLHFEEWTNQNYEKVFKIHKVFYHHIKLGKHEAYCERERTWKVDLLIQEYLKYVKRVINCISELKLANFIMICFQEYIKLEGLDVQ